MELKFGVIGKQSGKYEGTWLNGKEHACGIFTWPNGIKVIK